MQITIDLPSEKGDRAYEIITDALMNEFGNYDPTFPNKGRIKIKVL